MEKKISLNFLNSAPIKIIDVVQGDTSRKLEITIQDHNSYGITSAKIYCKKPDGTQVYNNCTVTDGIITATLTSQMLAVVGKVMTQIVVYEAGGYTTSYAFIINVQQSYVQSSAIVSTNEWGVIQTTIGVVDEVESLYQSAFANGYVVNSIAQMTNVSRTYILRTTGVMYYNDGTSWKPMTAYATRGEFNSLSESLSARIVMIENTYAPKSLLSSYATSSYVDGRIGETVKKGEEVGRGIAIGDFSIAGDTETENDKSLAVGSAIAKNNSIAIGNSLDCSADNGAIQIGEGETKADNGQFKVKDFVLLDSLGKIPEDRISNSIKNGMIKFVDNVDISNSEDGIYMTRMLSGSDGGIGSLNYFLCILQTTQYSQHREALALKNGTVYISTGGKPEPVYSSVVDNSTDNAPTCQAVKNYVDSHSSAGWQKIADLTVTAETVGVGTGTISIALGNTKIKEANRFMLVVEPFTAESKANNSITINAYIRPETGTYYSFPIFNAPNNNLVTKANSLNYSMSIGDIANNGNADAIALVVTHGITQYGNINSDSGNTRHGTYTFNASRIDDAHLPFLHLIATNYNWEIGSKASLFIM